MPPATPAAHILPGLQGLEDQLLGIAVAKERPDLEDEKNKLIIQGAENKRKLKEIEDEILRVLSTSEGNILEDEGAVDILQSSKMLSNEISEKQMIAEETEAKIDEARAGYKPVAHHSSLLYFVVSLMRCLGLRCSSAASPRGAALAKWPQPRDRLHVTPAHPSPLSQVTDLGNIDPMYQYSLRWFIDLFVRAIRDSAPSDDLDVRLQSLNTYFTLFLYQNVCRWGLVCGWGCSGPCIACSYLLLAPLTDGRAAPRCACLAHAPARVCAPAGPCLRRTSCCSRSC